MNIPAMLLRFFLLYGFLAITVAAALNNRVGAGIFGLAEAIVVSFSVRWACASFAKANRHYFNSSERTIVGICMLFICLSVLAGGLVLLGASAEKLASPGIMVMLLFFSLLYFLSIIRGISATQKSMLKNGTIRV